MLFLSFAFGIEQKDQKAKQDNMISTILLTSIIQNYVFLSVLRGSNNGLLSTIAHRHGRDQNYLNFLHYRCGQITTVVFFKIVGIKVH